MMLSRDSSHRTVLGVAVCLTAALMFAGSWLSSSALAEEVEVEMTVGPATPVEVLEQLNAQAVDEEGEPTGEPTYHAMMAVLQTSGLVDELGLGADFACAVAEEAEAEDMAMADEMEVAEEEPTMPERSAMTVFVPHDAAFGSLSEEVIARLASEQVAARAFVQAHTIADEVTYATVRGGLHWFTTASGTQLRIAGIQPWMVISPGTPAHMFPKGEQALCSADGPVFVLHFLNEAMDFTLPPPEVADDAIES